MKIGAGLAHQSLYRQLLIPLVFGFVLLVVTITTLVFFQMGNSLEQSIKKHLLSTSQKNKSQLESLFSFQASNIAAWAKLEVMDDIITEDVDGRISRSVYELKTSYQLQGDIFVFDQNQQLIASSSENIVNDASAQKFSTLWETPTTLDTVSTGKYFDPITHQAHIALIHKINASFDSAYPLGFLVITIPWYALEGVLNTIENKVLLFDQNGQILINSVNDLSLEPSEILVGIDKRSEISAAIKGYLVGTSVLENVLNMTFDWTVVTLEDESEALTPIHNLGKNILLVSVSLTVLVILLVVWLTRSVVRPIQQVTKTVLDITQSADLSKRVVVESNNETGILANSFNLMTEKLANSMSEKDMYADRLAKLNKNLEQQVQERTQAYRDTNLQLEESVRQLKHAQTQLIQSEKMASLGQLVAGIAHEINNPLGSINANVPVLLEYTDDLFNIIETVKDKDGLDEQLYKIDYEFIQTDTPKLLSSIKNAVSRMKEIVLSLRNFSRLDEAEVQDILLEDALDNTLALLTHRLKTHIEIEKHYQLNREVTCYPGLINQVFMNLLANAEQAIDGVGKIIISTEQKGNFAFVKIQDTGTGIDAETIKNIFDPFFTTKPVGEGTGMGLSISYGIIEKHNGSLEVDSELGMGTCFTISLPMKQTHNG